MEGIRFEGFTGVFAGDDGQGASAGQINGEGSEKNDEGDEAGLDMDGVEKEAGEGFVDDVNGGEDEEAGFDEGGEILEFAVAIGVALISGLV